MGSYTFKWEHPANEVYVTGTFDDWQKTEKLTQRDAGHFDKTVYFKSDHDKIYYKFVVDGTWTTNHTLPQEDDGKGNINNVLFAHEITPTAGFAALSSAAPHSTTAALAGEVSKATPLNEDVPGAFPETPAFESGPLRSQEPTFGVAPLPATTGVGNPISLTPGTAVPSASTVTPHTVDSNVALDREAYEKADSTAVEPTVSVAPLPATTGIGNPISLAPGAAVPHHSDITSNTLDNNITLDKEAYERGDSTVGGSFAEPVNTSSGMFGVPPVTTGMIPESSLPMPSGAAPVDGAEDILMRSSAAPTSTTAMLAGAVPLEPRREATVVEDAEAPAIVQESQMKAHADPEASANPVAVDEKKDMESELLSKVPEAPAAADSSSIIPSSHQVSTAIVGGAAAAGAALAGAAVVAKSYMPESIRKSIDDMNATSASRSTTAAGVPEPVKESIAEAHESPEAASNTEAVVEKKAMERELASVVPVDNSTGEHAPTIGSSSTVPATTSAAVPEPVKESIAAAHTNPEAAANPEAVAEKSAMEKELLASAGTTTGSAGVPETVKESIAAAHTSPEAAANPEAVREKSAMEKELESKVLPAESSGEPAPAISAATATHAPATSHEGTLAALEGTAVGAGVLGAGTAAAIASGYSGSGPTSASGPLASAAAHSDPNATAVRSRAAPAATGATTSSSGPVVTTGIETTPTPALSTPNPSTPTKVTDPAAPVANQGALKAAQQASTSTVSPAAARPSTDSPKSDTTDKSAKKKKRFSVFIDKIKEKLK